MTAGSSIQRTWPGSISKGPASVVAADIHQGLGRRAICGRWPHCTIQVACHSHSDGKLFKFSYLSKSLERGGSSGARRFRALAQNICKSLDRL